VQGLFRQLTGGLGISFAHRNLPPPTAVYVSNEDFLHVVNYNSHPTTQVLIRARLLTPAGQVQFLNFQQAARIDRGPTVNQYWLGEGFLIGLVVATTSAQVVRGQTFVQILLVRGTGAAAIAMHQLTAGYVSGDGWLGWPSARMDGPAEGPGFIRSITGTTPAAGAMISEAVPTLARWRLQTFRFDFTTAYVGNPRTVHLQIDDGSNVLADIIASTTQALNLTRSYSWFPGPAPVGAAATQIETPTPLPLMLSAGWRIRTTVDTLNAADQFAAPRYSVEEWINEAL
jgi:hypothetical protein